MAWRKRHRGDKLTLAKYRNQKVMVDGIKFDSKREANRYSELKLMEQAKVIRNLETQKSFQIIIGGVPILTETGRVMTYRADFTYYDVEREESMIEDVKGLPTPVYRIKKALMRAMGYTVTEIK